jgi:hypothetical protein
MRRHFLFIGDGHPLQHVRTNIEIVLGKDTSKGVERVQNWVNFKWTIRNSMIYEVWQKSNATGNAVHEPTMLLPPPSHGS